MKGPGVFISFALSLLLLSCKQKAASTHISLDSSAAVAPEINTKYGWLNTDKPYSIKDLRGKIVLLDFWTYECINCQHIAPDLEKLENQFSKELVILGIHSAKFDGEKTNARIQNAIENFAYTIPL